MKSAGGRLISKLFNKYLFQSGITFHGGMVALSWPWGSPNHKDNHNRGHYTPDENAFKDIGKGMASVGGSFPSLDIGSYPTNTLTNGIYDVPGTL